MKVEQKNHQHTGMTSNKTGIEQAKTRTEITKMRTEQAKTRTELVKTRAELAKTRTEQVKTRAELVKTRTEQVKTRSKLTQKQGEKTLQRVVHKEVDMIRQELVAQPIKEIPLKEIANHQSLLDQLTNRQREILRLIAEGQNTKQVAEILKVSPKTVEYHRRKLMEALNVYDIPGLVRFALRVGLIPPEG
jgi:DNA-binding CsgD family transcriptional regulator